MAACTDCAKVGSFWKGEPTGEFITYKGTKAYVSRPKGEVKKAILMAFDVFGFDLKNNLLLNDKNAANGYLSVMPDYFEKHPCPVSALKTGDMDTFRAWVKTNGPEVTTPISEKFLDYLKEQGISSVGAIGYCWGGRPAVYVGVKGKPEVKAIVVNHGSFITDDEVKAITAPSLWNGADNDHHISKQRFGDLEKIQKDNNVAVDYKFYPDTPHGWTCKGDEGDEKLAVNIEDAYKRGISWFNKHL